MKRFKYISTNVFFSGTNAEKEFIDLLDKYGEKGWEVISLAITKQNGFVSGTPSQDIYGTVYFKRPRE
jgi:hypothetical protein